LAVFDRLIRRRLLLGLLLTGSLVLLTVFFRESAAGPLHGVQNDVSAVATPAESVVQRVAQPFRDAWSWSRDLVNAKQERDSLARQLDIAQHQVAVLSQQKQDTLELQEELHFVRDPGANLGNYVPRGARVTERSADLYSSTIGIDAGSANGVHLHDPVVTGNGWLVGSILSMTAHASRVQLINAPGTSIGALVVADTPTRGVLSPSVGDPNMLILDNVEKSKQVLPNEWVTTAGWCLPNSDVCSRYPRGLPIGVVSNVNQTENDLYKVIQVTPWADLGTFSTVLVLERKGAHR
jgi:rod shape-determining protein MreC